jgi:hypothetical protein
VCGKQQLHVRELEAERFDVGADRRRGVIDAGVDEDVAFLGGDEVDREVVGADVINKGRRRFGTVETVLRKHRARPPLS